MHRTGHDPEHGGVSPFVAITIVALFLVATMVYEGSTQLRVARHTTSVAGEAARVAGQEIDAGAISGQAPGVNAAKGQAAARQYLADSGASGNVVIRGDKVVVTVSETWHGSLIGSRTFTDTATATTERVMGGKKW